MIRVWVGSCPSAGPSTAPAARERSSSRTPSNECGRVAHGRRGSCRRGRGILRSRPRRRAASKRRKHRVPGRGCLPGSRLSMPRLQLAAGAIPGGEPPGSRMVWRGALAKHAGVIGSRPSGLERVTLSCRTAAPGGRGS
jgi:hypothetical protein